MGGRQKGKKGFRQVMKFRLFLSEETIDKFRKALEGPPVAAGRKTLDIVYEDNDVLVVNKPQGMLSQKAQKSDVSLTEYITEYVMAPEDRLRSVFRPGYATVWTAIQAVLCFVPNLLKEHSFWEKYCAAEPFINIISSM